MPKQDSSEHVPWRQLDAFGLAAARRSSTAGKVVMGFARSSSIDPARVALRAIPRHAPVVRSADDWRTTVCAALREAVRRREAHVVAVLRETLATIHNAEAVDASAAPPVQHGVIAGGVVGLGTGEVPRRRL